MIIPVEITLLEDRSFTFIPPTLTMNLSLTEAALARRPRDFG